MRPGKVRKFGMNGPPTTPKPKARPQGQQPRPVPCPACNRDGYRLSITRGILAVPRCSVCGDIQWINP